METNVNEAKLVEAARSGDSETVRALLEAGVSPDACDEKGLTALNEATYGGHTQIVSDLLEAGADVDYRGELGFSDPLTAAATKGHLRLVQLLLDSGADPDGLDKFYYLPLVEAARKGHHEIVQLLLKKGAMPNALEWMGKDTIDDSSMHYYESAIRAAASNGHSKIVRLLLESRAADKNYDYNDALTMAAEKGHCPVIKAMLNFRLNEVNTSAFGSSWYNRIANQRPIIEKILGDWDQDDTSGMDGYDALFAASRNGNFEIVKLLLDAGANPNAEDQVDVVFDADYPNLESQHTTHRETPLIAAAKGGHKDIVRALLIADAEVDTEIKTDYENETGGGTALIEAANNGSLDIVNLLIAHGANLDISSGYHSETALSAAATSGHIKIVEALLSAGVNVKESRVLSISSSKFSKEIRSMIERAQYR